MGERRSALTRGFSFWQPTPKANCVQIGPVVTTRRVGESVSALLDRAIRDYPDKRATLVLIGWRDAEESSLTVPLVSHRREELVPASA